MREFVVVALFSVISHNQPISCLSLEMRSDIVSLCVKFLH